MTGFDPFFAAALAGLTAIVTDVIKTKGGKLLEQVDRDILKPGINKALKEYVQKYAEEQGKLKHTFMQMGQPRQLEDIYTAVQVLGWDDREYYKTLKGLEDLYRKTGKLGFEFESSAKTAGIEVTNQKQYLMVLGGPGIGKSTFLRKVGLEALRSKQGKLMHKCIPVFLELKQFNSDDLKIEDFIAKKFKDCGFPEAETFTQGALEKGKLLILLDGLDEVPAAHLGRAITEIQNLVTRHSNNRFIASCRVAAYKGGFDRFTDIVIAPLEDKQIREFIFNWFQSDRNQQAQTAEKCWNLLQQPEYAAAKELAQTPLLLTLLCVIYDELLDFPKYRATLYGEALDIVLKKWAAAKRLHSDPIYRELSPELERDLLKEIAYNSFSADQLFLRKQDLIQQIKEFLISNLNAPKSLDGEAVLTAVEVQQGILVERVREIYSFSHLTSQKYLTAQYLVNNRGIEWLVENHLVNQDWREVFLLVAGLLPGKKDADDLLRLIEDQTYNLINTSKLKQLLDWANKATEGSAGDDKPAAKRSAALYVALVLTLDHDFVLTLNRDFALTLALDLNHGLAYTLSLAFALPLARDFDLDLVLALALTLARVQIFTSVNYQSLVVNLEKFKTSIRGRKLNNLERKAAIGLLCYIWFNALGIESQLLSLNDEEKKALADYFYANELIIKCRDAAVRVSPQVWEGIEARMLTVREE